MKTSLWLNGPLEFLDEKDRVMEVVDAFWLSEAIERPRGSSR
jgi:2,4'-dihydroxyacetophenone dioxygenase